MKKTVFVVGAGASTDFGLPLGRELAEKIRVSLDQDFGSANTQSGPIAKALMQTGLGDAHVTAARDLRGALLHSPSIDHALFTRRDRPLVIAIGKIAIADQILRGERASPLPDGWTVDRHRIHDGMNGCRQTWVARLFSALLGDRRPEEIDGMFDDVAFVVFNYDRCVEQYIFYALQDIAAQSAEVAAAILKRIPIVHVYGHLGLPHFLGGQAYTQFGAAVGAVAGSAASIKTYTEGAEAGVLANVHELIGGAERVVFLGFGFDPLNIRALYPEGGPEDQILWGTKLGLEPVRLEVFLTALYGNPSKGSAGFADLSCSEFVETRRGPLVTA